MRDDTGPEPGSRCWRCSFWAYGWLQPFTARTAIEPMPQRLWPTLWVAVRCPAPIPWTRKIHVASPPPPRPHPVIPKIVLSANWPKRRCSMACRPQNRTCFMLSLRVPLRSRSGFGRKHHIVRMPRAALLHKRIPVKESGPDPSRATGRSTRAKRSALSAHPHIFVMTRPF